MTSNTKKSGIKLIIGVVVLAAIIAAFVMVYRTFSAKPAEGNKSITIEVIGKEADSIVYELHTDVEYLRQAMDEADGLTFSGEESEFGLMIDSVNGETADFNADGAYWSFYVNGEYCNYGIDTQPVYDGDQFLIEYTADVKE